MMYFFLDTADTRAISKWKGLIAGVTTNPTLLAKAHQETGESKERILRDICALTDGPVSIEVNALSEKDMCNEAYEYLTYADNVCIKLPATLDGFRACRVLTDDDVQTNITLCFSVFQALAAAQAGATFVSPFVGRLDDRGENGLNTLKDIVQVLLPYPETVVLAASLRNEEHVKQAALMGCGFATIPPTVFENLLYHPLTEKGLEQFQQCASL
jgi:transaldolase